MPLHTHRFSFRAKVIYWRGPAPYVFAQLPEAVAAEIRALGPAASYGWGVIPVAAEIGGVDFTTSLFPREGGYLLPLKVAVRRQIAADEGAEVTVEMTVTQPRG